MAATSSSGSASLTSPITSSLNLDARKPLWQYVTISSTTGGGGGGVNWECNFCHMQKKTTYTRVVNHLLKRGGGIKGCPKVTDQDTAEMLKLMEEEERKQIASTPKTMPLPPSTKFTSEIYRGYDDSKKRKGNDNSSRQSFQ